MHGDYSLRQFNMEGKDKADTFGALPRVPEICLSPGPAGELKSESLVKEITRSLGSTSLGRQVAPQKGESIPYGFYLVGLWSRDVLAQLELR